MYLVNGVGGQLMSQAAEDMLNLVPARDLVFAASSIDRIDPVKLRRWRDRGVTIREASYDRPEQMRAAYEGVDRMLLVSTWMIGETRRNQHARAIAAARSAGVRHIVYTSIIGAEIDEDTPLVASDHNFTERAIRESGLEWSFTRNAFYSDASFQYFPLVAKAFDGIWPDVMRNQTAGWVAREDCALAAAHLLAGRGEPGKTYTITGPELLTVTDLFDMVYEKTGWRPTIVEMTEEELYAYLDERHVPRSVTGDFSRSPIPLCSDDLVKNSVHIGTGYHSFLTDTLRELTGRSPLSPRTVIERYM